jgi:hypothetical protein
MDKDNGLPWEGDEFHGQGGSYVYDPKTGKRTLVHRTKDQSGPTREEALAAAGLTEKSKQPAAPAK